MNKAAAALEWKSYWPVVLAASVGFSFMSMGAFTLGLFIEPLQAEFGWSRGIITTGVMIVSIVAVIFSPMVGIWVDRYGTRPIVIPGMILAIVVISSYSLMTASIVHWLAVWVVWSFVGLLISSALWTTAVSSVFTSGRSLALGLTLCGTALAQMIGPPAAQLLIAEYGWRTAYVLLAVGWGTPSLLLTIFCLHDAHSKRYRPISEALASRPDQFRGLTYGQALRNQAMIRIGLATLISIGFGVAAMVHQVPILVEAGVTRENAAYLAAFSGLAGIIGKLATGWMMDRFDPGLIAAFTMATMAIGFTLLLEPFRSPTLIIVAMVVIGYGAGTKTQICADLTCRYGGLRNYGKIFGTMASILALASGFGPMLAGMVFDRFDSYSPMLIAGIPGSIIAGLLLVKLGPWPDWDAREAA